MPHDPDLTARCSEYRSYGWWVDHDHDTIALVVGGRVSALLLPADLAAQVQQVLSIHMLDGPVLGDHDHWVLLTQPDNGRRLPDDLAGRITQVRAGKRIPLPVDEAGWIQSSDRPTPPWQAVVSATRRVLASQYELVA